MISNERLAELVAFEPKPSNEINSATQEEWRAMARELQALRKALSEPAGAIPADDIQWLVRGGKAEISIHWINYEGSLMLYRKPDLPE